MKNRGIILIAVVLVLALGASGCSMFMDAAVDRASDRVAENMVTSLSGPMYRAYAMSLMGAYFFAGGYWLAWHPYQPGDWTRWVHEVKEAKSSDEGPRQPLRVEKAFLKRNADGGEWWRLKATGEKPEDTVIFEALFTPDRTRIVRMLGKMGPNAVTEIKYEEGENAFPAPSAFDERALKENSKGEVQVTGGSVNWSTNHVVFTAADGSGQADFYFTDNVPGGLVKYQFVNKEGSSYSIMLEASGGGARSELGAF